jgi:hypothetical protein
MTYWYFIVEGRTEEEFVKEILKPYLENKQIFIQGIEQVITGKSHIGKYCKGGGKNYDLYKNHILKRMKQFKKRENLYFTTMIDLYALPKTFPNYEASKNEKDKYKKIAVLESAFKTDINQINFLPYIQLHEFETLLFSDLDKFKEYYIDEIKIDQKILALKSDVKDYDNIELINESSSTAPSKRIEKIFNSYCSEKATAGLYLALEIGLDKMRKKCKHFNEWIETIENLSQKSSC